MNIVLGSSLVVMIFPMEIKGEKREKYSILLKIMGRFQFLHFFYIKRNEYLHVRGENNQEKC